MKVVGIVAEYNPFHKGHKYQIDKIRKEFGADFIVVAMSGNFLQRGVPALCDKFIRTEMALKCGADLVIEIPTLWSTASAEYYAHAGVSILASTGIVTHIAFGAETDNLDALLEVSSILKEEPDVYRAVLANSIRSGSAFPVARKNALITSLPQFSEENLSELLDNPNNILALEYMIALKERNSNMQPFMLKREGADYHKKNIQTNEYPSATAIRNCVIDYITSLSKENFNNAFDAMEKIEGSIPHEAYHYIIHNHILKDFLINDDFSYVLHNKLLTEVSQGFTCYADVTEDISGKIVKNINHYQSFSQFCDLLKSKDITHTRISRCLLHILLNIKEETYSLIKENDYTPYAKILGFRKESADVLSVIKKKSAIPLISKLADASVLLDNYGNHILNQDILCSHLYNSAYMNKKKTQFISEYERQIIKV